jgi:hypothetical protein
MTEGMIMSLTTLAYSDATLLYMQFDTSALSGSYER